MFDLRAGKYQDVMQDVRCTALISDPPFSDRVHTGRRTGSDIRQSNIHYAPMTAAGAVELAEFWHTRTERWAVLFADHETWRLHEAAWSAVGWYTFAPVPWIKPDAPPRMSGDGPAVACEWLMIARPRHREAGGSRPGFYTANTAASRVAGVSFPGKKPLPLMRQIIRDYTVRGDIVADPFAGTGTTLWAAVAEGRDAFGSEMDPDTYAAAANVTGDGLLAPNQPPLL